MFEFWRFRIEFLIIPWLNQCLAMIIYYDIFISKYVYFKRDFLY